MGTPVREPTPGLPGLERRTYWVMPLHLVVLAGWFKIVGVGLWQMRLLAILWGAIGLGAVWSLLWRLTRNAQVVSVAAALSATDYV
jgi:4-amino-4-deoxy-L-arabinose transferase-like glycosyltransferase